MPNSESIPIVVGLLKGAAATARNMTTDGSAVTLRGSKIVRVSDKEGDDPSRWKVELNLCGWGDTRTTRNSVNSILCRLNLPYRVGLHKHVAYLYKLAPGGEINGDGTTVIAITPLPENGWTTLPNLEEQS
jgi:hypothetical protein